MSTAPSLVIEPFDRPHLDAIVECVVEVWTTGNVIARALTVTPDDYRPVARRICEQALADDLGLMLRDPEADRVVGFYTAIDLVDELAQAQDELGGDDPKMRRWAALLSRGLRWCLDTYFPERAPARGEVLYFNIGGALEAYRQQGLVDRLNTASISRWVLERGYPWVLVVATHPHSIMMVRTLPFPKVLHDVPFAEHDDPDLRRLTEPSGVLVAWFDFRAVDRFG